MRILAIQLNQPGDALLTTPALRWLTQQGHEVHALLQPLGAELLQGMPGLASVEALPRGSLQLTRDWRRARRYRQLRLDRTIVFSQCSDRPALWAALSGARERVGLTSPKIQPLSQKLGWINRPLKFDTYGHHAVEVHLLTAGAPPETGENAPLWYAPLLADRAWAETWLRDHALKSGAYLHLHVGARWPSKLWPIGRWAELIHQIDRQFALSIVVTCGKDRLEIDFAHELARQAPQAIYEVGTLTVSRLGALLAQAAAFVGVDSMPMHLAAALQIPGVALFGPTDEMTWGPWQSRLEVVRQGCRCLGHARLCPPGPHSECLLQLSPEPVLKHLSKAFAKAEGKPERLR